MMQQGAKCMVCRVENRFYTYILLLFLFSPDAGMNDYISKPIKREVVFEMVKKWTLKKE
jgi:CheY-like chemotaxis protein